MATSKDCQYCDLLLVGRTGQGKSTLGNKLLQHKEYPEETKVIKHYSRRNFPIVLGINEAIHLGNLNTIEEHEEPFKGFNTADNAAEKVVSITKKLEIVVNKTTRVRVVDTPGFADTDAYSQGDVDLYQANLQIFRLLLEQQNMLKKKLQVRRVVYFLPQRGIIEKADADLQLELKVMHHFFGDNIFNCMVLIATNQKPFQTIRLDEDEKHFEKTRHSFTKAMELGLGKSLPKCPPIVYIGIDDKATDVLDKIQNAEVILEKIFLPKFHEICARCGIKLHYVSDDLGNPKLHETEREKNKMEKYEESCCHPCFIPRSSKAEKIIGTIVHVATLGIPALYESLTGNETWAAITTSDEMCPFCHQFPGAMGCRTVETTVDYKLNKTTLTVLVKHSESL